VIYIAGCLAQLQDIRTQQLACMAAFGLHEIPLLQERLNVSGVRSFERTNHDGNVKIMMEIMMVMTLRTLTLSMNTHVSIICGVMRIQYVKYPL